jgi:hypothetical protein
MMMLTTCPSQQAISNPSTVEFNRLVPDQGFTLHLRPPLFSTVVLIKLN